MKNLFFSLAFMLVGVVGFANTEVVETSNVEKPELSSKPLSDDGGTCTVIIRSFNSDGECTGSQIHTMYAASAEDCNEIGQQILTLYQLGFLKIK